MPSVSPYRKPPRTPPGCEDHLTRQQAAQLLGFSSEFKIRQLEREGRLQSVRGPMRTAFYARADVLAVKAELGRELLGQEATDGWTDAELLLLLRTPNRDGRQRTALDLVLETRISIERAERVFAFWAGSQSGPGVALPQGQPGRSQAETTSAPQPLPREPKSAPPPAAKELPVTATKPDAVVQPSIAVEKAAPEPAVAAPASSAHRPAAVEMPRTAAPASTTAPAPAKPRESDENERRGEDRLSRDALIAQLRDPDPRVRGRAFALLKELQAGR
jgi:hypothetical protein